MPDGRIKAFIYFWFSGVQKYISVKTVRSLRQKNCYIRLLITIKDLTLPHLIFKYKQRITSNISL